MSNVTPITPRWYAAYTAPRHEKTAAAHLVSRGIENYLAVCSCPRNWNGRRVVIEAPLFPGYLFVHILSHDRMRVLEAPGILSIVGFNGQLTPIPDEEITSIRAVLQSRSPQPHPYMKEGERVRIVSGPLRGLEGVIVRQTRRLRLVVSVDCIMRSFEVELEPSDLAAATVKQLNIRQLDQQRAQG